MWSGVIKFIWGSRGFVLLNFNMIYNIIVYATILRYLSPKMKTRRNIHKIKIVYTLSVAKDYKERPKTHYPWEPDTLLAEPVIEINWYTLYSDHHLLTDQRMYNWPDLILIHKNVRHSYRQIPNNNLRDKNNEKNGQI